MLVLTRRKSQRICIGDDIVMTIVDIRGGNVRIGFECPKDIEIHREEVYNVIQAEKKIANEGVVNTEDAGN